MAVFEIKDLTFRYPLKEAAVLNHIDLLINEGEFIAVCGISGCGKTTLLRHLKSDLAPYGTKTGEILYCGEPLEKVDLRRQTSEIGFVLQNPEHQIVTDKVWHELAFGLENIGISPAEIRLRTAEMASFFGIQSWFDKDIASISGGQKQLLNLAAVMAMQPKVLLLDEPTAQLDPIAASEFIGALKKLNQELGVSVVITEHRLEEILPICDRVMVMQNGSVLVCDTPVKVGEFLKEQKHPMFKSMPSPMKIYAQVSQVNNQLDCPVTVKDGRKWLSRLFEQKQPAITEMNLSSENKNTETILELKDICFRYERNGEEIIKNLSMKIEYQQLTCITGANATGKTTAMNLMSGILKPYRGKVLLKGKDLAKISAKDLYYQNISVVPQNPQTVFTENTVELDLLTVLSKEDYTNDEKFNSLKEISELTQITHVLQAHPYDLSGGEQQRAAIAKALLCNPKLLFLDEPTKGMDSDFKEHLAEIFNQLKRKGVTVVMVSHDIEFCAEYTDRCAMFFNGSVIAQGETKSVLGANRFYTTSASRMSRHLFCHAVTNKDVVTLCNENLK